LRRYKYNIKYLILRHLSHQSYQFPKTIRKLSCKEKNRKNLGACAREQLIEKHALGSVK